MRKTFFGIVIGIFLSSIGIVVAQTPTIFAAIRVNGLSELRGNIFNSTGDVTIGDNLVVTGTCTGCGAATSPGGVNTNVQYNDSGAFGGDAGLTFNETTNLVTVTVADEDPAILLAATSGQIVLEPFDGSFAEISFLDGMGSSGSGRVFAENVLSLITDNTLILSGATIEGSGVLDTPDISASEFGYKGVPQNIQAVDYTLLLEDAAMHIYHASGAGAGDTYTIPADASVEFPIGTVVTFVNDDSNDLEIAITSDSLTQAGTTDVAPCLISENGMATALKVTSTSWIMNGTGLTCT